MVPDALSTLTLGGTGIVRLGTNHVTSGGFQCEFYDMKETNVHLEEFYAATTIDDATYKPFDPEKEIQEIPETISFTLEREEVAAPKPNKPIKKSTAPRKRAPKPKVAKSTNKEANA